MDIPYSGQRDGDAILRDARALQPLIAAAADATERERCVPVHVMDALNDARLFRIMLPPALGGEGADALTYNRVVEAVAMADASTAWCLAQTLTSSHAAGFLAPDIAREVFGAHYGVVAWGPAKGNARAIAVDGGYRATGKWSFASGAPHAHWFGGHSLLCDADGKPRLDANGRPQMRTLLMRPGDIERFDTWHVLGLKGTRSDDYAAHDVFVPEAYTTWRDSAPDRREAGRFFNIPILTLYGVGFSGVALGIAQATLDAFRDLAQTKASGGGIGSTQKLRDNAVVQSTYAQSTARIERARAYLHQMLQEVWQGSAAPGSFPLEGRARLRLAITGAIQESAAVVTVIWGAAASSAIYMGSPFERRFRDIHTLTAHGQSQMSNFESAGLALFGTEPTQRL